jgi:hypothetical protein
MKRSDLDLLFSNLGENMEDAIVSFVPIDWSGYQSGPTDVANRMHPVLISRAGETSMPAKLVNDLLTLIAERWACGLTSGFTYLLIGRLNTHRPPDWGILKISRIFLTQFFQSALVTGMGT